MLKRLSGGQELGELVSTARNTYANPGNFTQFEKLGKKLNLSLFFYLIPSLGSSDPQPIAHTHTDSHHPALTVHDTTTNLRTLTTPVTIGVGHN